MESGILGQALKKLEGNETRYSTFENYYDGNHNLAFATEKFANVFGKQFREFALNLCPAVCDAASDKLIIEGFRADSGGDDLVDQANEIWKQNRMNVRADEVHSEALKKGDSFVIVWPDPDGRITIYPQTAELCTIEYDPETPGRTLWAAKYWRLGDRFRVNVYFADRIERWISKKKSEKTLPAKPDLYEPFDDKPDTEPGVVENSFGTVPMFHFANNAAVGKFGTSELKPAIPLQDALNKSVLDMLVAMEFSAFRQRYASGIDVEFDGDGKPISPFVAGAERLWVSENPAAKFGDFAASDLKQFLEVKNSFKVDMALVTSTPLYYFFQVGAQFPSGEALKKAETRFINKIKNRQERFGQVWEDIFEFAIRLKGGKDDVNLGIEWQDPSPLSEMDEIEVLRGKLELGVSRQQLLRELGYGEQDIEKIEKENAANAERDAIRFADSFNAGEI